MHAVTVNVTCMNIYILYNYNIYCIYIYYMDQEADCRFN